MNTQQFFTSLLDNHHIKISEQLNELHIEVINLDTSNVSSCIITEHDLDPKNSMWFENLAQLSQSFFKGLDQPSEAIKVSITEGVKICLFMMSPKESTQSQKVFEYELEDIPVTTSVYSEKLLQRITDNGDLSSKAAENKEVLQSYLRKSQYNSQQQQMDETNERLKKLEDQMIKSEEEKNLLKISFNNLKTTSDLRLKKLEANHENSTKTIKHLEEEIKKFAEREDEKIIQLNAKLEEILKNAGELKSKNELDDFELIDAGKVSSEDTSNLDNDKVNQVIGECYGKFKTELENACEVMKKLIKDENEKAMLRQREEGFGQYQELLDQKVIQLTGQFAETNNKVQEVLNSFTSMKKNFEEKTTVLEGKISKNIKDQKEALEKLQKESLSHDAMVTYVNETIQEVKEVVERNNGIKRVEEMTTFEEVMNARRVEDKSSFEAKFGELKESLIGEIQTRSNDVKEALKKEAAVQRIIDLSAFEDTLERAAETNKAAEIAAFEAKLREAKESLLSEVQNVSNSVKDIVKREVAEQRDTSLAILGVQLESVKEAMEQKIKSLSNKVEGQEAALVASESFLKEKIVSTNLSLTEAMNREIQTLHQILTASLQDQNQAVMSEELVRKINSLEKLFKQTFLDFKPIFDSELQYISEDKRTAENQDMLAVGEKSFFSQNALPDTGKYSISFRYEQGEFKDDGSLLFGIFPYEYRQRPLLSPFKYLVDVLQQEALLGENKVEQFNSGELNNGTVIKVYVDADGKRASFAVGGEFISTFPLSNWLNGKMHCGFLIRNNKKFKISFV